MIELKTEELCFIHELSERDYSGNTMKSNTTEEERRKFDSFKNKLRLLAEHFKHEFNSDFGEFVSVASSGNPIKFGGVKLNRIWSGISKGAKNKQYSAQISFVVDAPNRALDVGFYFGSAASRGKSGDMDRLQFLGKTLSETIKSDQELTEQYEALIDFGFKSISNNGEVSSGDWLEMITNAPQNSKLVYNLKVNENGIIDLTTITLYVKILLFLMSIIPTESSNKPNIKQSYLSPEQRARQAERRALIGLKGEKFVFNTEKEKLQKIGINYEKHLSHVSLISDSFGYDIASCDENKEKLFIEVKTTTRRKNYFQANQFFMSKLEYDFYTKNKERYKLYRVYDIEGNPELEEVYLDYATLHIDSYRVEI